MTPSLTGMLVGALLAITWLVLGFWACVFVAVAMVLGAGVARLIAGTLDIRALADALHSRRVPS